MARSYNIEQKSDDEKHELKPLTSTGQHENVLGIENVQLSAETSFFTSKIKIIIGLVIGLLMLMTLGIVLGITLKKR